MTPDDEIPEDDTLSSGELHGVFTPLWQCSRIEVEWIIKNQLPVGTHFLAGPPKKAKKSTAALAQAIMVSGRECNAFPSHMREVERTGRVVVFSPEAEGGILRQAAEDGLAISPDEDDESILVADEPWDFKLDTQKGMKNFHSWMREIKPVLAILDPLNRLHSSDENSSSEMMAILGPLGKLAHELRMCLLIIHHITKPPKDAKPDAILTPYDMRGSGALFGMADGITTITPKKDGFLHLESVFKRSGDFARTIKLGVWGEEAREWLSELDKNVWLQIKTNGGDMASLTEKFDKDEDTILEVLQRLIRNRLIVEHSGGYHA